MVYLSLFPRGNFYLWLIQQHDMQSWIKSAILVLRTLLPDGVDIIKSSLKEALNLAKQKKYNVKISYISAPKYKIDVKAEEYKKADNIINEISNASIKFIEKNKGHGQLIE